MNKPLSTKFISFDISYDAIQKFIQEYISCSSKVFLPIV
jgi:hypothetical protein